MNLVSLIGNLATDPVLHTLDDDRRLVSFLLAVDRPGKDSADFLPVVAWNRRADAVARHLRKGARVAVEGRIRSRTLNYDEASQSRMGLVEVVADRVTLLSPRADE